MGTMFLDKLPDGAAPKYRRVVTLIQSAIDDGRLKSGEKLPPVRELAWQLKITPGTVARAYALLTEAGSVEGEVGRGTFVSKKPDRWSRETPIEIDTIPHQAQHSPDSHDVSLFSPHLPSMGQTQLIRELLARLATGLPSGLMHYPSRENGRPARRALARWLAGAPLGSVSEDDVVLSHGGQNAIVLVLQTALRRSMPVLLTEELSYPGFRRAAEILRADVIPVETDAQGVIPASLEAVARNRPGAIFCTSPEVHNPTCAHTPIQRRRELVDTARRCDLQIIEDDCYHMGLERGPSYRLLAPERGWYVSSISKMLTPALRFGFALAPQGQAADLRRTSEYASFGLATPLTDLIAALLSDPRFDTITRNVGNEVNRYIQTAVNILGGFDLAWREAVPFLWLTLPPGWRAGAFCLAAETRGVQIRPAEDFIGREARAPHAVRLAVNAGVSLQSFENALHRLRDLLDNPPEGIGV